MTADERLERAEGLLGKLEGARARLEATDDPEQALELLSELAEIAKQVEAEISAAKREADAGA